MYIRTYALELKTQPVKRLRQIVTVGLAVLLCLLVIRTTATPTSAEARFTAEACPGAVTSQLQVGMVGQVSITPTGQTPRPVRVHQLRFAEIFRI